MALASWLFEFDLKEYYYS